MPSREEPQRLVVRLALSIAATVFLGGAVASMFAAWNGGDEPFGQILSSRAFLWGVGTSILLAAIVGVATALAAMPYLGRLSRAIDAARRMADGDLGARAPESGGIAGTLGRVLNSVATSGGRLLLSVRREQGRLNEQIAI